MIGFDMFKKFLTYIVISCFLLDSSFVFGSTILEEILRTTRPDRSKPLCYTKNQKTHEYYECYEYYEYYLSGKDNECAFKGFDSNRVDALRQIKERAKKSNNLQKILIQSINAESLEQKQKIFTNSLKGKYTIDDIEQYLNYYQSNNEMIECPLNLVEGEMVTRDNHHTLLHALAYTLNISLKIYTKSNQTLSLCDRFILKKINKKNQYPVLNLLHHNGHYNLLLNSNNDEKALQREQKYLKELANSIEAEHLSQEIRENPLPDVEMVESDPDPNTDTDTDMDTDMEIDDYVQNKPSRLHLETSERHEDDTSSSRQSASPPQERREISYTGRNFTEQELIDLLQRRRSPQNINNPLDAAYTYLGHLDRTKSHEAFSPIVIQLTKAKILTDHQYLVNDQNSRQTELENVVKNLIGFINDLEPQKKKTSETKRTLNYARIYSVKILCCLQKYQEAFDQFVAISSSYTKSSFIDIAEIIIHGFVPVGMTNSSAREYASHLLDGKNLLKEAIVSPNRASSSMREAVRASQSGRRGGGSRTSETREISHARSLNQNSPTRII